MVCGGITQGPVCVWRKSVSQTKKEPITNIEEEKRRLQKAVQLTSFQLQKLHDKAAQEVGKDQAEIFKAHGMILEDEEFLEKVGGVIEKERVNAEYAVSVAGEKFAKNFSNLEDDYLKARAADVQDVANRLIKNLRGEASEGKLISEMNCPEAFILVARDLSPSETVQLDKNKVLAIVTVQGTIHSHAAILARTMNIPALVGVPLDLERIENGTWAIVDGSQGIFLLDPSEEEKKLAEEKMKQCLDAKQPFQKQKGKETVTKDGRKIHLYANIGQLADVNKALEQDAEGIGLFRSECLYLGRNGMPREEEQFQIYKEILRMVGDKKVIIRTVDIGADKDVDYLDLRKEDNPALGLRGIRLCLKRPEIFKPQLRALFRSAVYGNLSVMYPMITSIWEMEQIQKIVEEVERELRQEGTPYQVPEQGIMVETPAAVMISEELAQKVDFFSIGTNDLTQYTLAADRQNQSLEEFYDPHHPAILRMIQQVIDSGHKYGKWVGICGELASDPQMTETFLQMGIDELSVAPSAVLDLRKVIRKTKIETSEFIQNRSYMGEEHWNTVDIKSDIMEEYTCFAICHNMK